MLEIVVAGPSIYYIGKGGAGTHAQLLNMKTVKLRPSACIRALYAKKTRPKMEHGDASENITQVGN
ncbi:hypothetical protein E5D57_000349 [Metarhizium anisopliae]|nr:hypothetical protein E5D57_000349 [Metarhizium anisopliae]